MTGKNKAAFEQWLDNFGMGEALRRDFPPTTIGYQWFVAAFSAGRAAGLEEAARMADELMRQCEKTCQDLAEESSEAGVQMYLRADGAADALEQLAASIRELKDQSLKEGQ
jgi:hypothetical protein